MSDAGERNLERIRELELALRDAFDLLVEEYSYRAVNEICDLYGIKYCYRPDGSLCDTNSQNTSQPHPSLSCADLESDHKPHVTD